MRNPALPLAFAALFGLAACQTTDESASKETIEWDTPPATPSAPPPPPPPHASAPTSGEPQCREYETTIMIGGKPEKAYGRACRQPDGTWKEEGVYTAPRKGAPPPTEQSFPYGWYGYDYPDGPRYGPGGMSVGVGAGTGGGWFGYGVGF